LLGKFARKGAVDSNKSVLDKLLYLCVAERAHRFTCIRRHEILISLGQRASLREAKQARLIRSSSMSPPGGSSVPISARSTRARP
jgi:hypothetical protein